MWEGGRRGRRGDRGGRREGIGRNGGGREQERGDMYSPGVAIVCTACVVCAGLIVKSWRLVGRIVSTKDENSNLSEVFLTHYEYHTHFSLALISCSSITGILKPQEGHLSWAVYNRWTGLLDWTTGLPDSPKIP